MLQLALAGLLASSLALGPNHGDDDKKKTTPDSPRTEANATQGVFETASDDPESITLDTYAQGRPTAAAPIKFWVQYAYGTAQDIYDTKGDVRPIAVGEVPGLAVGTAGQVESQRVAVGAQVNFLTLPSFTVGAGAQLGLAKNSFQAEGAVGTLGIGDLESGFGPQQIKVYGTARGNVLGVHAGYAFDLGDPQTLGDPVAALGGNRIPQDLSNSDGRDAIFVGADFDYPSERFRLMGGIDYFFLQSGGANVDLAGNDVAGTEVTEGGDYLNFLFGGGLRFSVFELGAALQLQARMDEPTLESVGTTGGIGSHIGTVVPYLNISPPSLPASIYIKGATPDEYLEYGLGIGGANSVQPGLGFTVGLSVGFE